ncbi:SPAG5 protein, partial [Galbula dea]|nr:SPAG5 protein [Galbula dea]
QSEKQLQELVKQQEEKLMKLMDHSSEVKSLNAEVCQLKRLLQRAETEAKVLWQEMQSEPNADTTRVQERIRLWQEVDKLQQLMLDKDDEKRLVSKKY